MNSKNQLGISTAVVILLVVALLALVGYYLATTYNPMKNEGPLMTDPRQSSSQYEELQDTESTPEELDSSTVEELDELIDSADAIEDEDLSDLEAL